MHQNLMHAQQLLHSIDQMASQLRQQEAGNRQLLSQIEQKEAQAAQNLQRIQQMCQECSQIMQNTTSMPSQNNYGQSYQTMGNIPQTNFTAYQSDGVRLGQPQNYGHFPQTQAPMVDPSTMNASTYHDSLRQFGNSMNSNSAISTGLGSQIGTQFSTPQMGTHTAEGYAGQSSMNMEISTLPTNEPFASTANMEPSKYQSAAKKLGNPLH